MLLNLRTVVSLQFSILFYRTIAVHCYRYDNSTDKFNSTSIFISTYISTFNSTFISIYTSNNI